MAGPSNSQNSVSIIIEGLHVLLVDSDLRSLASMARMFGTFSYKVTTAKTGRAALSILSDPEFQIELILIDLRLPDIDGFIVLKEAVNKQVSIIPISADDEDPMLMQMAMWNGATFVLQKPITSVVVEDLWQHVARDKVKAANGGEINGSPEPLSDDSDGESYESEANSP